MMPKSSQSFVKWAGNARGRQYPLGNNALTSSLCLLACSQRDGCPKIINLGSAKTDLFYERKKYGFKKR
eukprot:1158418-Pelagomonas_calceolata.AAC.2